MPNTTTNLNQNAGPISLVVKVDQYCPVKKRTSQDFTVQLNDRTIKAIDAKVSNSSYKISNKAFSVPGVQGIGIKAQPLWLSSFAFVDNGTDKAKWAPIGCLTSAAGELNFIQLFNQKAAAGQSYYWWQSWFVDSSPLVGNRFDLFTKPSFQACPIDSTATQTKDPLFDLNAGQIFAIQQTATTQGKPSAKAANTPADPKRDSNLQFPQQKDQTGQGGCHWKLTKLLPIFMGQQFQINLTRTSVSPDVSTFNALKQFPDSASGTSLQQMYNCINSMSSAKPPANEYPPANSGVVIWSATTQDDGKIKYTPDEASRKRYNLYTQPYYVVQLGTNIMQSPFNDDGGKTNLQSPAKYVLIIPQNYYPTLIQIGQSDKQWTSRQIAVYDKIIGHQLIFGSQNLKISWKCHLGKFIINFNSMQEPWIIEDPNRPLTTPCGTISVWGGFLKAKMYFLPLVHPSKVSITMPTSSGDKDNPNLYQMQSDTIDGLQTYLSAGKVGGSDWKRRIQVDTQGIKAKDNTVIYAANASSMTIVKSVNPDGNVVDGKANFLGLAGNCSSQLTQQPSTSDPETSKSQIRVTIQQKRLSQFKNIMMWSSLLQLSPGDFDFGQDFLKDIKFTPNKVLIKDVGDFTIKAATSPVISTITYAVKQDDDELWQTIKNGNISNRVLNFSDQWSSSDYYKIDHTGSMSILMNDITNYVDDDDAATYMPIQSLWNLAKRNFYVTVDAVHGCGPDSSTYRLFTGIGSGGTITQKAGMITMDVKLKDYMQILQNTYIFNSPFFDGMKDTAAVYQLLQIAKLRSSGLKHPAGLILQQAKKTGDFDSQVTQDQITRDVKSTHYALPISYNRIQSPKFRFSDGAKVSQSISDMAKKVGKVCFFDQHGIFHFQNRGFDDNVTGTKTDWTAMWQWRDSPIVDDTSTDNTRSQTGTVIHDSLTIGFAVQDVYSQFVVISATPNGQLIKIGHLQSNRIKGSGAIRPDGWLGYNKRFMQMQGLFGDASAISKTLDGYKKFIHPPRTVKFSAYGMPARALDIASIQYTSHGLNSNQNKILPFLILNTSSSINPKQQTWIMQVDGQWLGTPVF